MARKVIVLFSHLVNLAQYSGDRNSMRFSLKFITANVSPKKLYIYFSNRKTINMIFNK